MRKRCTYAFVEFALGRYDPNSHKQLRFLFNQMTVEEKHDILSLNFKQIWRRVWLDSGQGVYWYFTAECKYNHLINEMAPNHNPGKISTESQSKISVLHKLINGTVNGNLHWEIPKGRKHRSESVINCSIREFGEETGIPKEKYKVHFDTHFNYRISDGGFVYDCNYFVACAKEQLDSQNCFHIGSISSETVEKRWMSMQEILNEPSLESAYPMIRKIINYMKNKYVYG